MPAPDLEDELQTLSLDEDFYRVIGDASSAGVVVSRTEDPVDFADSLRNRVVNLVPVADIARVPRWLSEATQTVGIYPESLHDAPARRPRARAASSTSGRCAPRSTGYGYGDGSHTLSLPHDGMAADAANGPLDDRPGLTTHARMRLLNHRAVLTQIQPIICLTAARRV